MVKSVDDEIDRLMSLLEVGITAARRGDGDTTHMACNAALESAGRLLQNQQIIYLPDRSREEL